MTAKGRRSRKTVERKVARGLLARIGGASARRVMTVDMADSEEVATIVNEVETEVLSGVVRYSGGQSC